MNTFPRKLLALTSLLAGVLSAALAAALPACQVSPNYARPPMPTTAAFKSVTTRNAGAAAITNHWWTLFNDPDLTSLEEQALYANQDLRAAMARVAQARASLTVARSQFYPLITADPSITRSRAAAGRSGNSSTTTDIRIPFDLSYEVDIWGRVSRNVEAARAQINVFTNDFAVVLQTLQADIAQNYFNLRSLDTQSEILTRQIAEYRRQESLVQTRLGAGVDNPLALVQVQTQLQSTIAQEADLRRQRAQFEHALALLLGLPPSSFTLEPKTLTLTAPLVPPGLPSDLLARRPDVLEAEQALIAANANVGVAIANFYPTLTLTGSAGLQSFNLQSVVDWQSRFLSLGPNLSIPLFEGGRLKGSLQQAKARYDELLANYRQSLLAAYRDVEDNLSDLHLRAEAADAQEQAVNAAREYQRLSNIQFRQGIINSLQLIDADRTLQTTELTAAQIHAARLTATVLLIKSIGGGWDPQHPTALPRAPVPPASH
jgi:multidrug efflux system outer membrane protein